MTVGVARPLAPFSRVFDCLEPVSPDTAQRLVAAGYDVAGRYLENLGEAERDGLWAAGLSILLLTEMTSGHLSGDVGEARGLQTNDHCERLEVPEKLHVMVDLEATPKDASVPDVLSYADSFTQMVEDARRLCLLYVGAAQPLSGTTLYMLPHVHLYWRGGSLGIPEPSCDFALWQIPPLNTLVIGDAGHRVDTSMSGRDVRGRSPIVWARA